MIYMMITQPIITENVTLNTNSMATDYHIALAKFIPLFRIGCMCMVCAV